MSKIVKNLIGKPSVVIHLRLAIMSFLAKTMRYSSVINYYQTVIFYHNVNGKIVANWSDPLLAQTVKGMKKTRVSSQRSSNGGEFKSNFQKCKFENRI